MTIHEPGHPAYAWRCPTCGTVRAGYPSETAAIRAEKRHAERANHDNAQRSA